MATQYELNADLLAVIELHRRATETIWKTEWEHCDSVSVLLIESSLDLVLRSGRLLDFIRVGSEWRIVSGGEWYE